MLRELLPLVPQVPNAIKPQLAIMIPCAFVAGGILLLFGSRLARLLITLIFLMGGALIGLMLPLVMTINFRGEVLAVAGALVGGLVGYAMFRLWVANMATVLSTLWAVLILWAISPGAAQWAPPQMQFDDDQLPAERVQMVMDEFVNQLPEGFADHVGLVSLITAFVTWLIAFSFPRFGSALLFSLMGTLLLLLATLGQIRLRLVPWLRHIPDEQIYQLLILAGIALAGLMIQLALLPRRRKVQVESDGGEKEMSSPGSKKVESRVIEPTN